MENEACIQKRYGVISFTSFIIGIVSYDYRYRPICHGNFEENGEKSDFYRFFGFFLIFLYILGYRHHFAVNW
jgi:hypothetical protein